MARLVCPKCSSRFQAADAASAVCPQCGYTAAAPPAPESTLPVMSPATYGQALGYGYPGQPPPPVGGYVPSPTMPAVVAPVKTNGFAVTSLVLGILGIFSFMFVVMPLMALVFGMVGVAQCKSKIHAGKGMAVAGVVLGTIGLGIGLFFWAMIVAFEA